MSAKHTPGPWSVGSHRSIQSAAGTICETYSHMGIEEADSNERLISAAPELLESVNLLSAALATIAAATRDENLTAKIAIARAAIAKATGGAQ